MFKTKEDANLALILVKMYLQGEITKQEDYVPSQLKMHSHINPLF